MSDVIGRLVGDRAVVTNVMRAVTGRPRAGLAGGVRVDSVPVVNMTTGALARVRGDFADGDDTAAWSVVLKVVRSPDRSPIWAQIPPELHEITLAEIPWRTEPELYGSADLVRLFDRRARFARFLIDLARARVPFGHPRDAAV